MLRWRDTENAMMPTTLTPPPVKTSGLMQSEPMPHRWTIAEYRKLGETGIFSGRKTMLIHGEVYTMVFPNPPHDYSLGVLDDWLRIVFAAGHHIRNQMGFDVGTDNDPGPDLAVVTGTRKDHLGRTPTAAVMVVEVAETSLFLDTTEKAELYATAGVPDYWVLDVANRQLHVFRDPVALPAGLGATAYRSHTTHSESDTVSPLAAPTASIRVAELLP